MPVLDRADVVCKPNDTCSLHLGRVDGAVAAILMVSTLTVLVSCHQVCFIGSEYDPQSGIPPRWFLTYKDPCKCTAIRLGGMSIPASSYRLGAPCYLDELILSEDPGEIQTFFSCKGECLNPEPLGLEDGTISDDSISASSSYRTSFEYRPARHGRLNNNNHWAPAFWDVTDSWIEVDFRKSTVVSGVITQGSSRTKYRVTSYKVKYQTESSPCSSYQYVTDGNGHVQVFVGNVDDPATPIENAFQESFVATKVRIEPVDYDGHVVLRFELLGCHNN